MTNTSLFSDSAALDGGAYSFVACLIHLPIDDASLSRGEGGGQALKLNVSNGMQVR